ncbi:MAG: hypothetical protein ACLSUZ_00500 [Bifidobacterium pseudocatenulatum]
MAWARMACSSAPPVRVNRSAANPGTVVGVEPFPDQLNFVLIDFKAVPLSQVWTACLTFHPSLRISARKRRSSTVWKTRWMAKSTGRQELLRDAGNLANITE